MARKISGPDADAELLEWARRIAEAEVDLKRVRNIRRGLITRFMVDPSFQPLQVHRQRFRLLNMVLSDSRSRAAPIEVGEVEEMFNPKPPEGEEKLAIILERTPIKLYHVRGRRF